MSLSNTWVLQHVKHGTLTISLVVDAEMQTTLTVELAAPGAPVRRDEKRLKSYDAAATYVKQMLLEREVRGFKIVKDTAAEAAARAAAALAQAAEEAARPVVDPRHAHVLADGAVKRAGWLAISTARPPQAVIDELVGSDIDTVQLIHDGDDDDVDDDDDDKLDDDGDFISPGVQTLRRLAHHDRPALRHLILDTHWQTVTRQLDDEYGNRWGDLAVLSTLQQLEQLFVVGHCGLVSPLKLPALRTLSVVSARPGKVLSQLPKSTLPALTSLGIGVGGEHEPDDTALPALTKLLRSKALPNLTDLDVDGLGDPIAVLEAAAKRKLRRVRIAGALDDEDEVVPRLLALRKAYAGCMVQLALDTFSEAALQTVMAAWPTLVDNDGHGLFLPARYMGTVGTDEDDTDDTDDNESG